MPHEQGVKELKKLLISGIDLLVETEAARLKTAVETGHFSTGDQDGEAELLVAAGLLRRDGCARGVHSDEYHYAPTAEGQRIYTLLYTQR